MKYPLPGTNEVAAEKVPPSGAPVTESLAPGENWKIVLPTIVEALAKETGKSLARITCNPAMD